MIRINLLPFRAARKKENVRQQATIFVLMVILLAIGLGWWHIVLANKISKLSDNIKSAKTELAAYKKKVDEVNRLKRELEILQSKINVIKKLEANRKEPLQLLEQMTELIIPEQMWLTNLVSRPNTVGLSGIALDEKTTADFMINLDKSGLFRKESVALNTLSATQRNKISVKQFNITCGKAPYKDLKKEKAKK